MSEQQAHVRGEVQRLPLAAVKPNTWNPNEVPPHIMESIKQGFRSDGWLVSQSLLVWGTDENGERRMVIIDGEHRHTAALAVGLTEGPMVVLDGLSEAEAKQFTIKLNQRRGDWNEADLAELLRDLEASGAPLDALDLGFDAEAFLSMLSQPTTELDVTEQPAPTLATESGGISKDGAVLGTLGTNVRVVQLAFTAAQHTEYATHIKALMAKLPKGTTKSQSELLLELLREAAARP